MNEKQKKGEVVMPEERSKYRVEMLADESLDADFRAAFSGDRPALRGIVKSLNEEFEIVGDDPRRMKIFKSEPEDAIIERVREYLEARIAECDDDLLELLEGLPAQLVNVLDYLRVVDAEEETSAEEEVPEEVPEEEEEPVLASEEPSDVVLSTDSKVEALLDGLDDDIVPPPGPVPVEAAIAEDQEATVGRVSQELEHSLIDAIVQLVGAIKGGMSFTFSIDVKAPEGAPMVAKPPEPIAPAATEDGTSIAQAFAASGRTGSEIWAAMKAQLVTDEARRKYIDRHGIATKKPVGDLKKRGLGMAIKAHLIAQYGE